jgi:Domain of unknown function (DUF3291)
MHKIAFLTVGILHEQVGTARVQGFVDRIPSVYNAVDQSDGFQGRSIRDVNTWKHSWGEVVPPTCYRHCSDELRFAMTLSLWADLESVAAFAYHGPHAEALSNRREWFPADNLPTYVAWWVPADNAVDWQEAAERLDHLHANGSTAFAFNFSHPYDPDGNSVRLDSAKVKLKAAMNKSTADPHHSADRPAIL